MNEHDSLEAELSALQPCGPSAQLRRRIATSLAPTTSSPTRQQWADVGWRALVGGLVATGLVALVVWPGEFRKIGPEPRATVQSAVVTAFDNAFPSLWVASTAILRSDRAYFPPAGRFSSTNRVSRL